MPLRIEVANQQTRDIDEPQLAEACKQIAIDSEFKDVEISIAIVDDPTIHELNRQYLEHDYPTDVLSFPLERDFDTGVLQGEIIVSTDTAFELAKQYDWPYEHELLLYVIHGMLHLVGYDDKHEDAKQEMRDAETQYLSRFEIAHRYASES